MDDIETRDIEESTNMLIIRIRRCVNEQLFIYHQNYGIILNYINRNEIIIHTYNIIIKKYVKNSNFDEKKSEIIENIVKTYINTKYGMDKS